MPARHALEVIDDRPIQISSRNFMKIRPVGPFQSNGRLRSSSHPSFSNSATLGVWPGASKPAESRGFLELIPQRTCFGGQRQGHRGARRNACAKLQHVTPSCHGGPPRIRVDTPQTIARRPSRVYCRCDRRSSACRGLQAKFIRHIPASLKPPWRHGLAGRQGTAFDGRALNSAAVPHVAACRPHPLISGCASRCAWHYVAASKLDRTIVCSQPDGAGWPRRASGTLNV